ncbi:MAG: DUF4266 domain-containing protein [Gammaproteobacteria bacterium]|jgi:hypothetical protein
MRFITKVLIAFAIVASTGCSTFKLEPWVSPFERNNLADPIMSFSRSPADAAFLNHIHETREGARGAEGGSGGGCGCT